MIKITSFLYFVKQEAIGPYDTKGNVEYWTWVNKSNKENLEEIIKLGLPFLTGFVFLNHKGDKGTRRKKPLK